ncbi:uncharacterized protein LOC141594925 [Silene latifolia]|uniref:uncharacterized protein LOC141594925 n=1 Tax=Silene latifolia TaxID=37657 RepID=UPI003D78368B
MVLQLLQKKIVTGSYTKVKGHLLKLPNHNVEKCLAISNEVLTELLQEHNLAESRKNRENEEAKKRQAYVTLPSGSDLVQPKKRKGTVTECFNMAERDDADKECARMIYACSLPFSLVVNPHFKRFVSKLGGYKLSGYVPPSYNRLRTTLLAQEKAHIDGLLQPFRDSWKKKGLSLCSDGWTDRQRHPLINMMATSGGGDMFLKAYDTSGKTKGADYVSSLFLETIEKVGANNVVQIITDNAANFKAAATLIEVKYPHIFWTPCVVHSLNLALRSICDPTENSNHYDQCKWISTMTEACQSIRQFVLQHTKALNIFNKYSKLTLLTIAETRFASHIIMYERLLEVKDAVVRMILDDEWKMFRKTIYEKKADFVKECVLFDTWWDKVEYFLEFTTPLNKFLRFTDTDTPCLHMVYDMWDSMIEDVRSIILKHEEKDLISEKSAFFYAIQIVFETRWNKSNTPLHCLAHSLVSKYYCQNWLDEGNSLTPRVAPNEDQEVSQNRNLCFKRLFPNPDDLKNVYAEYGRFAMGLEYFSENYIVDARSTEEPLTWWANYGASTPMLQSLAFKLLSQPASSSCCERNWSIFSLVQRIKRSRLSPQMLDYLVFVHCNMRILDRKREEVPSLPTVTNNTGEDEGSSEVNADDFVDLDV